MAQPDLFGTPDLQPPGFRYQAALISEQEERALLEAFSDLRFKPFEFRGFTGKRETVSFGYRYDFAGNTLRAAPHVPEFLKDLRREAGRFAAIDPEDLAHVMITDYPPGAAIGWHRDRAEFGRVVGVSLLSPATFRFRRRTPSGWERISHTIEPRSAYLLDGAARSVWEHSIPPVSERRFSVTFRTLR